MSSEPVGGIPPEEPLRDDGDTIPSATAPSGLRIRDGFIAVALYVIGQLVGALVYLVPVGLYWRWHDGPDLWRFRVQEASTTSGLVVFSIVFSLFLLSFFARYLVRRAGDNWQLLGFTKPRLYWFVVAVGAMLVVNLASVGFEHIAGPAVTERAQKTMDIFASEGAFSVWPMVLLVSLVVPFFEEIVFRAILFRALATRLPALFAGVLSVCIFGIIHVQYLMSGLDVAALMMAEIALIGGALTWLYHKSGSIWPSVTLHALNNSMVMAILLLWPKAV